MSKNQFSIQDLSQHLFWDVDVAKMSFNGSKSLIIKRVLEYGLFSDWKIIVEVYGLIQIKETALQLRSLDSVSLSFLCAIFKLQKKEFRCYKLNQSMPNF